MGKASDYRRRKAEREPTTELELPSGAVFTVRRPPLEVWTVSGKIPQALISARAAKRGVEREISDDELLASILFVREALVYACVSPRLVVGATGEDEIDPSELDPEDFDFLSNWVKSGCPGVPVRTKGGEVSIDDLSRFRQKRAGGRPFSLEPDGAEVQPEAQRLVGNS